MSDRKPTLVIDFDVCHDYSSPWTDALTISDRVVPGFFEWAYQAQQIFRLAIYSCRSSAPGAIAAMERWIRVEHALWLESKAPGFDLGVLEVEFPATKPAAFLTIDDRALQFTGDWSDFDPQALRAFKPWHNKPRLLAAPVAVT